MAGNFPVPSEVAIATATRRFSLVTRTASVLGSCDRLWQHRIFLVHQYDVCEDLGCSDGSLSVVSCLLLELSPRQSGESCRLGACKGL